MKRTRLGPGGKSVERGSTFANHGDGLRRRTPLERRPWTERDETRTDDGSWPTRPQPKRRTISPASPAQRARVKDKACLVCAKGPCHPAHLIDRSIGGDDDPRAVVPLCPLCHRAYDDGRLDLLPHLEPRYREELAYAVELVGLLRTLERVTTDRWSPITTEEAA